MKQECERQFSTSQLLHLCENISHYYPAAMNIVQITWETSTTFQQYCIVIICTVEKLFDRLVRVTQNCHTLPLSLVNLSTSARS